MLNGGSAMLHRRTVLKGVAALGAAIAAQGEAVAQDYPHRPITLVVPFPPGGSTTVVARIIADKMSPSLGQSIVIDNRAGAAGTVGARAVARAEPDAYTLLLGYTGTLAISPSLYPNVGFDPRKDFAAIGRIGAAPSSIVVHPSFPVHSVQELIDYAKANPGKVNFGSAGVGSVNHIAGELFATMAGVKLTHIPYKGTGPALNDLLGGHILLAFAPIPSTHALAQSGALRMLAVTSLKRTSLVPDIPTVAESGLPGFEAVLRYGLVAPANTPRAAIDRLNTELRAALATPEVQKQLATEGAEAEPSTPEEYAADIDREETKWSQIVRQSGAKAD